ncbi:glutamic acid-rich protein-like [Homalodisca vitripennis]|uniref:glutamic acid-rich protein-like n=1 Tax=Homalodisca vitripennis TaxID=197043 RepID=UPI001EEB8E2A|nr:glutamic acid-rich protein-like [Homalodisca vitripennis]
MEENNSTKKDDDVCKGDNLTPRKIDRFLREPNEDDSDVNLSGESEVFDSDRDPEYHPSVDSDYSDTRKPRFSGLFEKRFERQGDQDNVAGPSITARDDVTSEDSEYEKLLKKKNYRKRKKAVKWATEKKKNSSKKKVTENETEQDKDEIDKTGDTSEEENKEEENYCEKDEDNNSDDDFDEDDEEENYQESQTEGKGKNKEKKRKRTAR